jgi:ElaB/YqjD/DUF883 family membrane-anchored ribosome-binding protein
MAAKNSKADWKQFRREARLRWEKLTEQDLDRLENRLEDMIDTIQRRYNYTRRRAEKEVRRFSRQYMITMEEVKEGVQNTVEEAQNATDQTLRRARRMVARRPLQAVLAAMTLGLALGLLTIPIRSLRK